MIGADMIEQRQIKEALQSQNSLEQRRTTTCPAGATIARSAAPL